MTAPDAETLLFEAIVHVDHIAMEAGSEAAKAARYCLNIRDEKTDYFMPFPSHSKDA